MIRHLGERYRHHVISLDGAYNSASLLRDVDEVTFGDGVWERGPLPQTVRRIRAILRRDRPDLLLTYNWGAIEWAFANRLFGVCAHIHFESGFGKEEADRQIRRRVAFRRIALSQSERVVVPSQTLANIARTRWKIPPGRLQLIPNGVDCGVFIGPAGESPNAEFRSAAGEMVIGTVAPLRPEKNLGRLIRAFAALGTELPVRLVIVGDGQERPSLETAARSAGVADRVVFAGYRRDVTHALNGFDVFAISSDTEQMPNSVLQAMACARPVAAVDVGDIRAMLSTENAGYVVPRDDDALARCLSQLCASAEVRANLGARNREHVVASYSLEHMVEAYDALFEAGCGRSRSAS